MGSNQGKQPHFGDRGYRSWSRDEKRWERNLHRKQAKIDAIAGEFVSNSIAADGTCVDCGFIFRAAYPERPDLCSACNAMSGDSYT
jgi:hypothetical protein